MFFSDLDIRGYAGVLVHYYVNPIDISLGSRVHDINYRMATLRLIQRLFYLGRRRRFNMILPIVLGREGKSTFQPKLPSPKYPEE